MDERRRDEIALFRYQVIAPLLSLDSGRGAMKRAIRELASKAWEVPGSDRVSIGFGTIEHWLCRYRQGGLPALRPSPRADAAKSRKVTGEIAQTAEDILAARPHLTSHLLLKEILARGLVRDGEISLSCIQRFRKARGLTPFALRARRDLRPFEFEFPCDCWQCDLMYGPSVPTHDGRMRKTYLYAVLDDATRLVCHAQFHLSQDLEALKDTFKQAFLKRGIPKRLYVDNAQIFRSKQLLSVAAQIGFQILYSKPYRPEGRGKIERWFHTVRSSFLPRLDPKNLADLDRLNRLLWAWIEGEYHVSVHRGIGEAPLDKWLRLADRIRTAPPDLDLDRLFLTRVSRRVRKDGTFTLKGRVFEAGVDFIGLKISVRF
ncbi:DDE-type integrase/transposase/recombinase, partial [Patescibacteria group bacterium]|nr:DDE-type integrase/transposase/recombinase [Patescibacteria group bacterium]